jgi:hypothetical protein
VSLRITFIFLFCLLAVQSQAQSFGTYAGEFLSLGAGARSLALGGTGVAFSNDATAGYWNPAGLPELNNPIINAMHEARFDNTVKYDYAAIAFPLGKTAGASLSVFHIGISDIKDTRNAFIDRSGSGTFDGENYLDYSKVTIFGNYDWGFYFSYGQAKDSNFSYGATFKFLLRKLESENSATGFGFDVGAKYKLTPNLILAAVGQDITTTMLSYTTGTKELVSPTIKLGGAYLWNVFASADNILMPVVDLDLMFENRVGEIELGPISTDVHCGLEYMFRNTVALRVGVTDTKKFTLGAGVKLTKLSIDLAYQNFNAQDELGNIFRASFAISLENAKWKRAE